MFYCCLHIRDAKPDLGTSTRADRYNHTQVKTTASDWKRRWELEGMREPEADEGSFKIQSAAQRPRSQGTRTQTARPLPSADTLPPILPYTSVDVKDKPLTSSRWLQDPGLCRGRHALLTCLGRTGHTSTNSPESLGGMNARAAPLPLPGSPPPQPRSTLTHSSLSVHGIWASLWVLTCLHIGGQSSRGTE